MLIICILFLTFISTNSYIIDNPLNVEPAMDSYMMMERDSIIPWYGDLFLPDTVEEIRNTVIAMVIKNEGTAYVQDASINEVSKMGITLSTYRSYYGKGNKNTIKALTKEKAQCIYKELFWDKNNLDSLVALGYKKTASVLMDSEVNIGPYRANKFFQRIIAVPKKNGRIDETTLGYLRVTKLTDDQICARLLYKRKQYYARLVKKNEVYAKYHRGWNRRLVHMAKFVKEV